MIKLFKCVCIFASIVCFAACGDDSSTSSAEDDSIVFLSSDSDEIFSSSHEKKQKISSSSTVKDHELSSSSGKKSDSYSSAVDETDDSSSSVEEIESSEDSSEEDGECWVWGKKKTDFFNPNVNYGELTDNRDGKKYRTITVGLQTWMAENLNYSDSVKTASLKGGMWCHEFDENCELAGAFYTWAAAIDSVKIYSDPINAGCKQGKTCTFPDVVQGICPDGWHVPDYREWETLFANVGGKEDEDRYSVWENTANALRSQLCWEGQNGKDPYGFSAIPAGYRTGSYNFMFSKGTFEGTRYDASFWTSSGFDSEYSIYIMMRCEDDEVLWRTALRDYAYPVRCLKDESSSDFKNASGGVWNLSKNAQLNSAITYGEFADIRDGKTYKSVTIGSQTWMAENLNYSDSTKTPSLKGKMWCYGDIAANCNVAGGLYTWAAAIDSVKLYEDSGREYDGSFSIPDMSQGICPDEWHLPSYEEWRILIETVGGTDDAVSVLKSKTGWNENGNGVDSYGFSAIPAGYRNSNGEFIYAGYYTYFRSADPNYYVSLYHYYDARNFGAGYGFSIRCIKD